LLERRLLCWRRSRKALMPAPSEGITARRSQKFSAIGQR
jgi:hypothetical protein